MCGYFTEIFYNSVVKIWEMYVVCALQSVISVPDQLFL
jgi:hypothetical protein